MSSVADKEFKEYFTKGIGSVTLLSYHLILPLHSKELWLDSIENYLPESFMGNARNGIITTLREVIFMACTELQYNLVKAGKIRDDGVVEGHPVIHRKYVALYLKLPATVSVHTAFNHIRLRAHHFLRGTDLEFLLRKHQQLFSVRYLAMCCAADPFYSDEINRQSYMDCCNLFMLENGLSRDRVVDARLKKSQLGKESGFMSDRISIYD